MSTRTVKVSGVAFLDTRHVIYLASDDGLTQLSIQYAQAEGQALPAEGDEYSLTLEPVAAPAPADPTPAEPAAPAEPQGTGNL